MRILVTTDVAGGVWSYTEELVDSLLAREHTISLVMLGGEPTPAQRIWLAERPALKTTAIPCPLEWMPEPEPGLSASVDRLRRAVDRFEPDVVHLNQFCYAAHDLGVPRLVVAHSDVVSWWRVVRGEDPPDDAWFRRYRGWVMAGLCGADARVAPSAWIGKQAESIYGASPVRVIHNARSNDRFRTRRRVARDPLLVTMGRLWDEAKGARDLIPAAALLGRRARIVVAGPIAHPAGGEDFPAVAPGIEWAGALSASGVRALLGRAQVYVAPSRYEPFGIAPLEAALAGCALLLSDIPTFRELWDGCALFYPAGDTAGLAEGARALLDDPDRRRSLAEAARTRALVRYSPDRMAAEYEALYRLLRESSDQPVIAD